MDNLIRSTALTGFSELVRELGGDPDKILAQVGIRPQELEGSEGLLTTTAFVQALHLAATQTQFSDFGLRLGVRQKLETLGPVGLLARQCSDAREALLVISRYIRLHNPGSVVEVDVQSNKTYLSYDDITPGLPRNPQICDLALGMGVGLMTLFLGKDWRPSGVYFVHRKPDDLSYFQKVFKAPLFFDQEIYALSFESSALEVSLSAADPQLKDFFSRYVADLEHRHKSSTGTTVEHLIRSLLSTGQCSETKVAHILKVHPRTLQRKLKQEGSTFKGLLGQIRSELAVSYLSASDIPLTGIATALGYSELSAFTRFFKERFGLAPSEFKKKSLA